MANRFQTITVSLLIASLIGFDASAQTYNKTVVAGGALVPLHGSYDSLGWG